MRVWAVTFRELGMGEGVLFERAETGEFFPLIFADSAYGQALAKFNEYRDDRLSFHKVQVMGEFGPDAHAHLVADDGDDAVELQPYNVIGG